MVSSARASAPSPTLEILALRVSDEADNLRDVHRAYAGLEKFISFSGAGDSEEIHATRSELSTLLRVLTEELNRRIEAVDDAIRSMCERVVDSSR